MRAPTACRRTVSGTISLFCPKCFSPFPHGTGPLSVSREYLALPDGPGGFTQDSSCPALLRMPLRLIRVHVRSCHALWRHFPEPSIPLTSCDGAVLLPRTCRNTCGLGCSPFARHYWGNHCCFLFLRVLRCFSSPRWPPSIRGSKAVCASPRLFAACRVLHRLREPRHPPCALSYFQRRRRYRRHGIYFGFSFVPALYRDCLLRSFLRFACHIMS